MPLQISTFHALPASIQTVTLDGVQYRLRLTWRHRCRAWFMDLLALDESPLVLGRRLSAGWAPNVGMVLTGGPPGLFFVRGGDGYERADLGTNLSLMYYSQAELQDAAAVAVASDGLTVEL